MFLQTHCINAKYTRLILDHATITKELLKVNDNTTIMHPGDRQCILASFHSNSPIILLYQKLLLCNVYVDFIWKIFPVGLVISFFWVWWKVSASLYFDAMLQHWTPKMLFKLNSIENWLHWQSQNFKIFPVKTVAGTYLSPPSCANNGSPYVAFPNICSTMRPPPNQVQRALLWPRNQHCL